MSAKMNEICERIKRERIAEAEIYMQENEVNIKTEEELSELIAELMCDFGPDGHCDGHELIAHIIWEKFRND